MGKAVTNSAKSDLNFGDYLLQRYFDERKQANKLRTVSLLEKPLYFDPFGQTGLLTLAII
ncbi:hypothetical protein Prede_1803 [Prevotella dentalis DSM 3688]|uniref:Uncharacterized protein n=1 Tax=Prevotella dentalis (strain ATCC 49559 / DSM 3688 / JCM 13448 / NCTC 12043 / ES 2772) TaxID=908937 RepID=L0JES4_PREDD|nr:hypothetical protein Prede_1803 [Prevotella dentalis DSM 3688]